MKKPKVLLLLHDLSLTGAPKVAIDLFEEIRSEIDLQALSLRDGPLGERLRRLCPVEAIYPLATPLPRRRIRARWRQRQGLRRLQRWIDACRPDVVYCNSVASFDIFDHVRIPEAPAVLHCHEMGLLLRHYVERHPTLALDWPTRYITVSAAARASLERIPGIDPGKVRTISACIPDEGHNSEVRASGNAPLVVGGSGTVQWRKGGELWLLMAYRLLELMGPAVRFVWVGMADNLESMVFREKAQILGIADFIEFVPLTPNPLEYYRRFDVFAMTSLEDPCPLVVLENMMLGVPVVAFSGGGGVDEELGDTGVLVPEFDPDAMAKEIVGLANFPDRRRAMALAARARVREQFTCVSHAPRILGQIRETSELNRF